MTSKMRASIEEGIRIDGEWLTRKMKAYNEKVVLGEINCELHKHITEVCQWLNIGGLKMEIEYDYIDYNYGEGDNPFWSLARLYKSFKVSYEDIEVKFDI